MRFSVRFALIFLIGIPAAAEPPRGQTYDVVRVVDGDTVVLSVDSKPVTFRLVGVDTPETVHPNKPVERFGQEASRFTKSLLDGKRVLVEREAGGSSKDKYGRDLAYLYLEDGTLVNKEIILQGYGFAYVKYPFSKMNEFRRAEQQAREAKRGLWGSDPGLPPEKPPVVASGVCGATTKSGTPCKRRVKGGGRCYQHGG